MKGQNMEETQSRISKSQILYPFTIILLMLAVFNLAGNIFSLIFFLLQSSGFAFTEDTATLLSLALNLIAEIGLILIFFFLLWRKKLEPEEKNMPETKPLLFTYLVYSAESCFLFGVLPIIAEFLSKFEEVTSPYESFFPTVTLLSMPIYYILFFGVLSFGAAISEELAFRRTLIPMLERRGLGTFWVLLISGLMFSLMHTPADLLNGTWTYAIVHFCSTFIGGVALGFVYVRTRNVIYPILLHGFSNGFSGLLQIAVVQLEMGETTLFNFGALWIVITILLGGVIVGYTLIQLYQHRRHPNAPAWIQLLTDRKVVIKNLKLISLFALIFILIQGGFDIILDLVFSLWEPSLEVIFFESVANLLVIISLIVLTSYFIWYISSPLKIPIFVSEIRPYEKMSIYQYPKEVFRKNRLCPSCGQEIPSYNRFCIYCGQSLND